MDSGLLQCQSFIDITLEAKKLFNPSKNLDDIEVVVSDIERLSPRAVTISLTRKDGEVFQYRPGQHTVIKLFIGAILHRRPYSISSLPQGDTIQITVQSIFQGKVSGYLNNELRVGDTLKVTKPAGCFTLNPTAVEQPHVFIAAGSGITPIFPLVEQLLRELAATQPIWLMYSVRTLEDFLFRHQIEQLAETFSNFRYRIFVTRGSVSSDDFIGKRMTLPFMQETIAENITELTNAYYFVCGPTELTDNVQSALKETGVHDEQILTEAFLPAAEANWRGELMEQQAVFKRKHFWQGDKRATILPGQSVLEAANKKQLKIRKSCEIGACKSCKIKLLSGTVAMDEPNSLSAKESTQGYILACVSFPLSDVVLELP